MHGAFAKLACNFVFVDSLSKIYTETTEIGDMEDELHKSMTSHDSPFKGKSTVGCHHLLRKLRLGGSDIDYISFVIMDERFLEDDTVLLVYALDEEGEVGEVRSLRASSEIVDGRLLGYLDGEFCSFDEDLEAVGRTEDGVLRV